MTAHRLALVVRCGLHELRCAECRVTWKSWAQRLVGIKAGYSPGAHDMEQQHLDRIAHANCDCPCHLSVQPGLVPCSRCGS